MSRIEWTGADQVRQRMGQYSNVLVESLYGLAQYFAPAIESSMKANAPWTDRTANARQGLWCVPMRDGQTIIIHAAQSMDYGVYLETRNSGRYAVVLPTLETFYKPIWDGVEELVK
jgi:hypothetical protein